MENIILVILFYFIATVLSDRNRKKKRTSAPERPNGIPGKAEPSGGAAQPTERIEFEIPHLEGAPPLPLPSSGECHETEDADAQKTVWESDTRYMGRESGEEERKLPHGGNASSSAQPDEKNTVIRFTPQSALQAVAMAEILGRPKAHRRSGRR